jgi:hypothetical protein
LILLRKADAKSFEALVESHLCTILGWLATGYKKAGGYLSSERDPSLVVDSPVNTP